MTDEEDKDNHSSAEYVQVSGKKTTSCAAYLQNIGVLARSLADRKLDFKPLPNANHTKWVPECRP